MATKIPPKNFIWPSKRDFKLEDTFPPEHITEYVEKSLRNLKLETIDLIQFHSWEDSWAAEDRWQNTIEKLKEKGYIKAVGISVNRWEPENVINTLNTGKIDAIQVVYNIFEQAPEDNLFPVCEKLNIGVIARCPFEEGALTGILNENSNWPEGDFRRVYFRKENLIPTVKRVDALKKILPSGMSLPDLALKYVLSNKIVSTVIAGMRKENHVKTNFSASEGSGLSEGLILKLREHRWDRIPSEWS